MLYGATRPNATVVFPSHSGSPSSANYTYVTKELYFAQTVLLHCAVNGWPAIFTEVKTKINVTPTFQEI
jgi:hypothetical protein